MPAASSEAEAWAASGAMALTGRADGPAVVAPDPVIARIVDLGRRVGVDGLALLGEHAAALALTRRGHTSCGGSARMVRAADGWLVANLARDDDRRSVAAWLELADHRDDDDPWPTVERTVAERPTAEVVARAALLGIPAAGVGEIEPPTELGLDGLPVGATQVAAGTPPRGSANGLLVIDLSSLWAGPLCARLLADRGAQVIKVESIGRPDGARRGPPAFYDRLHVGTRSVALDLDHEDGRAVLRAMVRRADVVIEASRARAVRGWGIDAAAVLAEGRCRAWVSITGYGREVDRVAFGDDAAAAGGLVAWDERGPCFAADAVADPLAGMTAAAGVESALAVGGRWLLDVSMAGVAAHVGGPERCAPWGADHRLTPARPRSPRVVAAAPALGVDNHLVGAELGLSLP